jgi:integrase
LRAKRPLTDRAIAALRPAQKGKRTFVWDALVPGLAVRVTDLGAKSFVLVTRYPRSPNPTARALGLVGAMGLADARERAREWHKLIAAGTDPALARASAAANTLAAICNDYLARDGAKLRTVDWSRGVLARLVYPTLGSRPIAEIRRTDIVALLDRIEDGNGAVMADRTLAIVRRVMNWHAARSDDFRSPIVRGMSRAVGASRERILTDDELRALWHSAEGTFGAFVRFLLLTAARRSEAAEMEWSEVVGADWLLPAARNKTGQELLRPLSVAAQAILAAQPRGEWVFSITGRRPLTGIVPLKAALDAASGVAGWTLHDLRRTARSLMSRAGVPTDHAERCLGHVIGGVRGVYDRHEFREEKRQGFEALAGLVERIVNPQANVVAIRGER